ncbi:MAG TPA: BTAD domain-containing putative transcriptional regulator, partial [Chthonomonadaceae bacterium]|nr:BTAD domain-containing putative transcriptional regulator [Chthonomonadaceae bacterium]
MVADPIQSPLSMSLFGPFDVRVEGQPLPRLRSRKHQGLLALLALRAGREVQRGWLAGALWPESSEAAALHSLRQSLLDVRKALGSQAYRLQSPTTRTLCLDLSGADVDALVFDAAIQVGGYASLERAVSLYRGPLLEGCLEEWALQERQAREQAYLNALEQLAEAALRSGDPRSAVRRLRAALTVDPLREHGLRVLIQALAALGDYGAVQQVYRDFRLLLYDELRIEPAVETVVLYRQIQADARQLHASGSEDGREQKPLPVSERSLAARLPKPLSSLIGREKEIQEIKEALDSARLVTIAGSGGVGKTRLAIQVAEELSMERLESVWFIDLAPLSASASAASALASELELREEPGQALAQTVLRYLQNHRALLVLDNCEHLV